MAKETSAQSCATTTPQTNKPNKSRNDGEDHKVRTVLFVEQTAGGKLAKRLREVEQRLRNMMGFSLKAAERGGTKLQMLLPNTNLGVGTLWTD